MTMNGKTSYLILSAIFFSIMALTRSEGIIYVMLFMVLNIIFFIRGMITRKKLSRNLLNLLMPVAVFLIWETMETKGRRWPLIGLTSFTLAGLGLTHYRVLIFAVIFLITLFFFNLRRSHFTQLLLKSISIGLGAGLIFLPWFIQTFRGRITTNFLRSLTIPSTAVTNWTQQYNAVCDLSQYLPLALWLLFIAAIGLALIKRMRGALVMVLWWVLILLATNPQWIRLPGEGAISNFAFFIAVYIPCSLTIGVVSGQLIRDIPSIMKRATAIILVCLTIYGIDLRMADLDYRNHTLVTRPDVRASEWIQQYTDPDSKFLTNAFFAYNDTVIVGSDGG